MMSPLSSPISNCDAVLVLSALTFSVAEEQPQEKENELVCVYHENSSGPWPVCCASLVLVENSNNGGSVLTSVVL